MKVSAKVFALFGSTVVLLAGCGESQPPLGGSGAMPQTLAVATLADRAKSWMLPEATSEDLLYVTNYGNVMVFAYPGLKLVGRLRGFYSSVGACVDAHGDVFITNYGHSLKKPGEIAEYAHGGTKPVMLLKPKRVGAVGCAIDPTTGNLAISGFGEPPTVDVFKGAKGEPALYKDSILVEHQFCGFDNHGNLFVAGLRAWTGTAGLVELPKGGSKFVQVDLDATISSGGGVQWDGKHMAIGAYENSSPVIYQFAIAAAKGTKVGTTTLGNPADLTLQFFISKDIVLVPNWYFKSSGEEVKDVLFYKYPAGGAPTADMSKHRLIDPRGVALSLAPK